MARKKFNWLALAPLLILLFGSGVIWQWMNHRIEQDKLTMDKMSQSVIFREKISNKLVEILQLIKEEDLSKSDIRQKYKVIEDDLLELERKVAQLEGREPRTFKYKDLIGPSRPKGLRPKIQ